MMPDRGCLKNGDRREGCLLGHRRKKTKACSLSITPLTVHEKGKENTEEHAEREVGAVRRDFIVSQPKATLATGASEVKPRLPSLSRKPMASGGNPGAAFGKITETRKASMRRGRPARARGSTPLTHIADRFAEWRPSQSTRGWWNDLGQCPRRCNYTRCHSTVIPVAQHSGSEIEPIEIVEAATTPVVAASKAPTYNCVGSPPRIPEQLSNGIQEILGHSRPLQHQTHEGEERDRQQRIVSLHRKHAREVRLGDLGRNSPN